MTRRGGFGIERRRDPHDHRRATRRPRKFVLARPLDKYRARAGASKQCGVECDVVGTIVPITSRTVLVDHLDDTAHGRIGDDDAIAQDRFHLGQPALFGEHDYPAQPLELGRIGNHPFAFAT